MKIATFTSLKGGVAKTAIGTTEATYLSFFGRVLFIDANPQKDASRKFIYKKDEIIKQFFTIDIKISINT